MPATMMEVRAGIKYRDLNFKFIDENKDFDSINKEMMKKYIYVEMINYYEIFYYYWKEQE